MALLLCMKDCLVMMIMLETVTVNTIIDCYKSNFLFSKQNVSEKTYLQMISADSGHIFADTGSDFSVFNTFNKSVP